MWCVGGGGVGWCWLGWGVGGVAWTRRAPPPAPPQHRPPPRPARPPLSFAALNCTRAFPPSPARPRGALLGPPLCTRTPAPPPQEGGGAVLDVTPALSRVVQERQWKRQRGEGGRVASRTAARGPMQAVPPARAGSAEVAVDAPRQSRVGPQPPPIPPRPSRSGDRPFPGWPAGRKEPRRRPGQGRPHFSSRRPPPASRLPPPGAHRSGCRGFRFALPRGGRPPPHRPRWASRHQLPVG